MPPGSEIGSSTAPEHMISSSGVDMYVPLTREEYNTGGDSGGGTNGSVGGGAGRYIPIMGTTTLIGPPGTSRGGGGEEVMVPISSVELGTKLLVTPGTTETFTSGTGSGSDVVLNPSTDVLNSGSAANNSNNNTSVVPTSSSEAELLLGTTGGIENFPPISSRGAGGPFHSSGPQELMITPPEHYPLPCFPVDPDTLPPPPEGFLDPERTSEAATFRMRDSQQEEGEDDREASSVSILRRSESSV